MRGTDVGISKKKNFPVFYGSLLSKKEGKNEIFFCKLRHFVNFTKFTKSLLLNLLKFKKRKSFSFPKSVLAHFDHLFTNLITPSKQLM